MADAITLNNFSLRYLHGEQPALKKMTASFPQGTFCAILGPTNAGKSTLLQSIAGVIGKHHRSSIASGMITINGTRFEPMPVEIQFPTVGLVLQDPFIQLSGIASTIREEIAFTLENLGTPRNQADERIDTLLRFLGIAHLAGRRPAELSGGETQRVALASILIAEPSILLLDEPITAIDSQGQSRLRRILASLRTTSTILVTDTSPEFTLGIADRYVVLSEGTILFDGPGSEFFSRLQDFAALLPVDRWHRLIQKLHAMPPGTVQNERLRRYFA